MSDKIILKIRNRTAEITLNNPEKLNCMGFEMLHALENALESLENDQNAGVVVFKGAGDRAFSTGADLKEYRRLTPDQEEEWIELGNRLFNRIAGFSKPTVAFLDGYAIGGGLELALTCDFRIGTSATLLSSPELQHGWLPGWGGMTRLRILVGEARAKEIVMLNEKIHSDEAVRLGLLTRVLTKGKEMEELEEILAHLASLNPLAFRLAKSALMDPGRTTGGSDLQFDIMAQKIAGNQSREEE